MAVAVTVLIATRNEEANIVACLQSVAAMDQIIVVDSQSSDDTVNLATEHGAEVLQFHYDGGWPKKRSWALREAGIRNEWVLVLDADERLSPEMIREIEEAVKSERYVGYYLQWKFMFLGRWMKHSWSHGWMLRLFRHGQADYEDLGMRGEGGWDAEVHENIVVQGQCARLRASLLHDTNQDLAFWIRKQNEFSTWNASRRIQQLNEPLPPVKWLWTGDPVKKRKLLKGLFIRIPFRAPLIFLWLYVLKLGVLDGKAGLYFCLLRAIHEINIAAKVFEIRQQECVPPKHGRG